MLSLPKALPIRHSLLSAPPRRACHTADVIISRPNWTISQTLDSSVDNFFSWNKDHETTLSFEIDQIYSILERVHIPYKLLENVN